MMENRGLIPLLKWREERAAGKMVVDVQGSDGKGSTRDGKTIQRTKNNNFNKC